MTQTRDTQTDRYAGHTPGPWVDKYEFARKIKRMYVYDSEGSSVAHVLRTNYAYNQTTFEANARLIAAAPKLLAENRRLREIANGLATLNKWADSPEFFDNPSVRTEIRSLIARAALADTEVES